MDEQCQQTNSSSLLNISSHIKQLQNKCNQCKYAFSQAGNLSRHLKTHIGEKSNQCSQVHHFSLTLTASSTRWPPCRLVRVQPIENPSQPLPSQLLVTVDFFLKFLKFFLKYFGSTLTSTASSRWPPGRLVRVQPIENPSQHLSSLGVEQELVGRKGNLGETSNSVEVYFLPFQLLFNPQSSQLFTQCFVFNGNFWRQFFLHKILHFNANLLTQNIWRQLQVTRR